MQAGRLNRRITIERSGADVDDGLRVKPGGWVKLIDRWAELQPLNLTGAERMAAGENAASATLKFRIRRTPSITITPKDRLIYGRRICNIVEVQEIGLDEIDLIATQRPDDPPDQQSDEAGG